MCLKKDVRKKVSPPQRRLTLFRVSSIELTFARAWAILNLRQATRKASGCARARTDGQGEKAPWPKIL
jgi:hypothetical protein